MLNNKSMEEIRRYKAYEKMAVQAFFDNFKLEGFGKIKNYFKSSLRFNTISDDGKPFPADKIDKNEY